MKKSIVLLSGGLDSLVNFKCAVDKSEVELVLTFDYGQHSAVREREAAKNCAEKFGISHRVIELEWLSDLESGLTTGNAPKYDETKLDDKNYADETAKAVWVPNRNGVFLNIAASFADSLSLDEIVVGFNAEEAVTFPDNTSEYLDSLNHAFSFSTQAKPRAICYTTAMKKSEIVQLGREIDAPFEFLWSCYEGGEKMCGQCESCRRLKRALRENGFEEPFVRLNPRSFEV